MDGITLGGWSDGDGVVIVEFNFLVPLLHLRIQNQW